MKAGFGSEMFHPSFPIAPQEIEPEAVFGGVVFREQFCLEFFPLSRVGLTFKNRVLNALAVVFADFSDVAQSFLSASFGGFHIIGNKNNHGGEPIC